MERHLVFEVNDLKEFHKKLNSEGYVNLGSDIFIAPFNIEPHCEYTEPQNFPNCCEFHKSVIEAASKLMEKFPNCCEQHKRLSTKNWFKIDDYINFPFKVVKSVSYFEQFVIENIDKDDWYSEITNFVDYCYQSFGNTNVLFNLFKESIIISIKCTSCNFPTWKCKILLEYINPKKSPSKNYDKRFDKLMNSYNKWKKILPKLSWISEIVVELEKKYSWKLIFKEPRFNKYLNSTKFKLLTEGECINELISATRFFVSRVEESAKHLPQLLEGKNYEIQVWSEKKKLELSKLLYDYSDDEVKYVNILDTWLEIEKKNVSELNEILTPKFTDSPYHLAKIRITGNEFIRLSFKDSHYCHLFSNLLNSINGIKKANISSVNDNYITIYPEVDVLINEIEIIVINLLNELFYNTKNIFNIKLEKIEAKSVVQSINNLGKGYEKLAKSFKDLSEEQLRDLFLPGLNTIYKNAIFTGETFNNYGKSDILAVDFNKSNVIVIECKIWKGDEYFVDSINQLFDRYLTWRDGSAALLLFNKDNKLYQNVLDKSLSLSKINSRCKSFLGKFEDHIYEFIYKLNEKSNIDVTFYVIHLNFNINF